MGFSVGDLLQGRGVVGAGLVDDGQLLHLKRVRREWASQGDTGMASPGRRRLTLL